MSELSEKLVKIYAEAPVEKVNSSDAYQKLCHDHVEDPVFNKERNRIETLRRRVDDYVGPCESHRKQVEIALRLLPKFKEPADQADFRGLVLKICGRFWDIRQRGYFEQQSLILIGARHYFLSFTSRNPGAPNINQVNRNHQFFIIDTIGPQAYEQADKGKRNLLAEAVHHLLVNQRFDGFYYPSHVEDNRDVEKKLSENCSRSLAFVQLVQNEMFQTYDGKRNWCHYEYSQASQPGNDRVLFVQIEEDIPGDDIDWAFDSWYKCFAARDKVMLQSTRRYDEVAIDSNYKGITSKLTEQIKRRVDSIYANVPV